MNALKAVSGYRAGVLAIIACMVCADAHAQVIAPELAAELSLRAPSDEVPVIVYLSAKVDHRLFRQADRSKRDTRLVKALRENAAAKQATHRVFLQNQGARRLRDLWLVNGLAVTAKASVIRKLAARPGVESIRLDSTLQAPVTTYGSAAPPEWNLNMVHAPDLWALGYNGTGVVVANMDTGVDYAHPDLSAKWRGGGNSWYDPHGEHATPHDNSGHGTQTMAIMVGGAAGGTAIGMAPGARWIAAKLYNDAGVASYSDIHLAFQWLLDPDGDLNTVDAPDVVNASWGLVGTAGLCITEFSADINALKIAGIAVAFAAGNDGPAPLTSLSPANNVQGFAAGAIDATQGIASFSSRGQSACDGTVYPKLVVPGVNINTADLSFGGLPFYTVVSGTSYAAPHAAGAMALLAGAFPSAGVAQIETALTQSAHDLGVAGGDNSFGYGLADVQAAYQLLAAGAGSKPEITSTPPTTATEGSLYSYAVIASDADGDALSYALDVAPTGMMIDVSSGLITWTPGSNQAGSHSVTVRVTDVNGQSATQAFSVSVANLNQAPAATSNTYSMTAGATLSVTAPGVLGNDSDADGDALTAVLASGTSSGSLVLNGVGSFSYTPKTGFSGSDSFSYRAFDGALYSGIATVSITVNAAVNSPPVAINDSATAAMRKATSYTPVLIRVLANDTDADGSLNPASVSIVAAPNKGGMVTVNADGTVSYTPTLRFRGKETFKYTVRDQVGALSNTATVTVSVQ